MDELAIFHSQHVSVIGIMEWGLCSPEQLSKPSNSFCSMSHRLGRERPPHLGYSTMGITFQKQIIMLLFKHLTCTRMCTLSFYRHGKCPEMIPCESRTHSLRLLFLSLHWRCWCHLPRERTEWFGARFEFLCTNSRAASISV